MRAVCIERPGDLRLIEVASPVAGAGEAVIDVAYGGICASDVEMLHGFRPAEIVRYPVTPGHEWSGVVAAVGDGVDPALVGAKVVGEGFRRCGACAPCATGDAVLCRTNYDETGFTRAGAWAEQLLISADQLHVLADDADLRSAAGIEPAACAADAVLRAEVQPGDRVVVVGGGTIGALAVQLLRAAQPAEVVVIEPDRARADVLARCGATRIVGPDAAASLAGSFDAVIESAGAPNTASLALDLARRGGRVVLAGIPHDSATLAVVRLVTHRVEIRTVFGAPTAAWRAAVDAFRAGALDPGLLVTHELELADVATAFELLDGRATGLGKILLRP